MTSSVLPFSKIWDYSLRPAHMPDTVLFSYFDLLRDLGKLSSNLWRIVDDHPLTAGRVGELYDHSWDVETASLEDLSFWMGGVKRSAYGCCDPADLLILYRESLKGLDRDLTVCHELVHAHVLTKPIWDGNDYFNDGGKLPLETAWKREVVVESLGRRARSDPSVLRAAVDVFGLEPFVYDSVSARAFPNN